MAKISNCVVEADVETATLWFMERNARFDHERPFLFTYPLEDGSFPSNLKHKSRDGITIRNLRNGVPSYEESGIGVLDLQTALEHDDYDDAEKVQTVLLPKVREALRLFLGAHSIHIIEYKLRRRAPDFPLSTGKQYTDAQPAIGAHVDYTDKEIIEIINVVAKGDTDKWRKHRVQGLNLWAPLNGPLRDWPLCVCDSSTVGHDDDLQVADVVFRDKVAENLQLHFSDRQQWYYIKDQIPSEFLIFRATDTNKPKFAAVPHCSFQCSQASGSAAPRESIEIRVLALHDHSA
ncbi:hypothetical protein PV11_03833 [Exophiala sideris]|uniref:Uncharacterized protein n=1 Tax=Exophiala sideris TaxID=1016849 RepID=A0A0D1YKT9_9EURO|nr:hypothetical protein PV11_03833 [Exophiala sideris]